MALKFKTKSKVASKPATEVKPVPKMPQSELQKAIDVAGSIQTKLEPKVEEAKAIKKDLAPLQEALKAVQPLVNDIDDDYGNTGRIEAERYALEYGKMGTSREVTNLKLVHEMLGDDLFYSLAGISLTALDDYLTPEQKEQVISESPSKRTFKITPRA